MEEKPKVERPLGVAILVVLQIIVIVVFIFMAFHLVYLSVAMILFGLPVIAVGWGLWSGKKWAWVASVLFYIFIMVPISTLNTVAYWKMVGYWNWNANAIVFTVSILTLYYLFRSNVKAWCQKA